MEIKKSDFKKINDFLWEIPKSFRKSMRVPARIYATEEILEDALSDRSVEQLVNVTSLPGIVNFAIAMPDIHEGYGFPIGGIGATEYPEGALSPAGIGFDQNCGMRILLSEYSKEDIEPFLENLADEIQKEVPSGLGRGRKIELADKDIENILKYGAEFLVENGYGEKEDLENCESNGKLKNANPSFVSTLAKKRGKNEVGTLGSGNHFLEIQKVEKVFDEKVAKIFGLFENQVTFMIHTGSRATGHQIASDYINIILKEMPKYNFHVPDKELASIPFSSEIGQRFYSAMCCGANYAFANRQMISFYVRKAVKKILGENIKLTLLYDVAHNIAKIETHEVIINNKKERKKLIVHRKGATRAFPAGNKEIPEKYRKVGQPVLIPGSMGTASYVLVGNEKAKESFYSVSHGSGRIMSRRAALKRFSANEVINHLKKKGILIKFVSKRSIVEEAPGVYKDIDDVVNIIDETGLAKKVARLKPLAVIKGE